VNYAILGFFLGIFGMLYVVGLPLSAEETKQRFSFLMNRAPMYSHAAAPSAQPGKTSEDAEFSQIICPKCYERQSSGNSVCEACGAKMI
jgi:ribosomal protein L40E